MLYIKKINESHIQLQGDVDEMMNISDYFSFFTPNYRWSPKYKAGVWDGKIRLLNRKNGLLPIGLFPRLKYYCKQTNIVTEIDFKKTSVKLTEKFIIDYSSKKLKLQITPRDYQIDGVMKSFAQQKLIIKSPTASGKSLILYIITKLFLDMYKEENDLKQVLIIVPTISLVEQMKGDFVEYGEKLKRNIAKDITTIYSGQEKDWSKKIIISTWQSLQNITDMRLFQKFGCVLVDEVFSAETAVQIQAIIGHCSNAKMKVGVAGTLNDEKINRIQLEGLFGKVNQETTTKKLIDNGTLSKLKIKVLILHYKDEIKKDLYKASYHDEMGMLQVIEERSNFIINSAVSINNNVLILFKNIKYGTLLYESLLKKELDRKVFYVAGSTKSEIREQVRKLTIKDNNAIIVASLGTFAIGINIPNLDTIIFGQNFKSKIKVLQSIGRILRKADTKEEALVIDIVDNLQWRRRKNYALKHALERIDIYNKEKFNYNIKEINI